MNTAEQQHYDSIHNKTYAQAMLMTLKNIKHLLTAVELRFAEVRERDLKPGVVVTDRKREQWRECVAKIDALNTATIDTVLSPTPRTHFSCDDCNAVRPMSQFAYSDDEKEFDYEVCKCCQTKETNLE